MGLITGKQINIINVLAVTIMSEANDMSKAEHLHICVIDLARKNDAAVQFKLLITKLELTQVNLNSAFSHNSPRFWRNLNYIYRV